MPVEVRRFSLGTPPERVIARGPRAGQLAPRYEVILPGWSDVIHVASEATLTPEERSVDRQRRGASLSRSPTPEVVANFAKIGQAIDDIQDGLVTLSVAGRLAVKLRGRAIPGVGAITTAADALNFLNIFYPSATVGAAVGAAGRAGAVLSGRRRYLASKSVKRALGLNSSEHLSTYLRRLNETIKTGRVGFGLGEALQVLQTSDSLFGFGVSLGPIFGGLQDTFFGLLRGARFDLSGLLSLTGAGRTVADYQVMKDFAPGHYSMYEARARDLAEQQSLPVPRGPSEIAALLGRNPVRVQVDFPGLFPIADKILGAAPGTVERGIESALKPLVDYASPRVKVTLEMISAAKEATVGAAVKVWNSSKWLVGVRGDLTWGDHLILVVAQALAVQELSPLMQQIDWGFPAAADLAGEQESLPFCGRGCGHSRAPAAVAACLNRGPARFPLDWLDEISEPLAREFVELLLIQTGGDLLEALEGPTVKLVEDSGVGFRSLRLLHDYNLLPPYDRTDEEVFRFLMIVFGLVEAWGDSLPPLDVVSMAFTSSFPGVEF